jgi:hypothetical protein
VPEASATKIASEPVVSGWTRADLLATLMLPTTLFSTALVGMFAPRGGDPMPMGPAAEVFVRFFAVAVVWLGLPVVTTLHWWMSRRRARPVAIAMPMLRAVWASLGIALTMVASAAAERYHGGYAAEVLTTLRGLMIPLGLVAALAGAWSQKGTHRRLLDDATAETLFWTTAALLVVPVAIGALATFGSSSQFSASSWIVSSSLPITAQLPIVIGIVVALSLRSRQRARAGTLALTAGAAVTACVHVLGSIRYGDWSLLALSCLFLAVILGLIAVAGTASPQLRRPRA